MAVLLDASTNQHHPLRTHHTLGRSSDSVDTGIANRLASRIHASLEWNGNHWLLRDLSRNGTWVDDEKVAPNASIALKVGSRLHFGDPGSEYWELTDISPPRSLLVGATPDSETLELKPYLFIPDDESPQMVLTYSQRRMCWSKQALNEAHELEPESPLQHDEILRCGDQCWRVFLTESANATDLYELPDTHLDDFEFVFDLSLDEENTRLQLRHNTQKISLGERSHHYLLLHLARIRASDALDGLDNKSQGWIENEQLSKDLGFDMSHINILIFRARKQFAKAIDYPLETEHLVERGKGRMRFGCPMLKIYKGEDLAYQLPQSDSP